MHREERWSGKERGIYLFFSVPIEGAATHSPLLSHVIPTTSTPTSQTSEALSILSFFATHSFFARATPFPCALEPSPPSPAHCTRVPTALTRAKNAPFPLSPSSYIPPRTSLAHCQSTKGMSSSAPSEPRSRARRPEPKLASRSIGGAESRCWRGPVRGRGWLMVENQVGRGSRIES